MNRQLAKITKGMLEIQERGMLNFWIMVNYEDGGCQGIGGICLDTYNKAKDCRVGTAYGCEVIRQLLLCMQVNDFSEMANKMVWVLGEGDGFNFKPKGIQRLETDSADKNYKKVIFDDIFKEFGV